MQAAVVYVGDKLKRLRTLNALTQAELAERAGLTTAAVSRIERDEAEPRPSTLRKLAQALNVQPRELTEEQAKNGYSLAQQLEALREYAARKGYEVVEEVEDPGQSGASLERPGMDHVRDLVAAEDVSVVLAQDRDRFAREPAYHYLLKKEFEEHGCKLRDLNDRGDDSPEGELTDGIL